VLESGAKPHLRRSLLDLDYDLSKVLFICTANTLPASRPPAGRLEIIRIAGYNRSGEALHRPQVPGRQAAEQNGLDKST